MAVGEGGQGEGPHPRPETAIPGGRHPTQLRRLTTDSVGRFQVAVAARSDAPGRQPVFEPAPQALALPAPPPDLRAPELAYVPRHQWLLAIRSRRQADAT